MLLSFDANRTITYVGNKVARILEFDTKDITGKKLSEYVHPEDLPVFEALFMESPKVGGESYDFRLRDKQGGIHYMRGTSGVYVKSDGDRTKYMLLTDITDKKSIEELLKGTEKRFKDLIEAGEEYDMGDRRPAMLYLCLRQLS